MSVVAARYAEQQTQTNVSRLRRGASLSFSPSIPEATSDFAARLRGLMPPEQRLSRLDRTLTGRAAANLVRQRPAAVNLPGQGRSLDAFVTDGGAIGATEFRDGEPLPAVDLADPPISASRLLGLSQRALGAPLDGVLEAAFGFLGSDTLSATPLRPATAYIQKQAEKAYGRLAA